MNLIIKVIKIIFLSLPIYTFGQDWDWIRSHESIGLMPSWHDSSDNIYNCLPLNSKNEIQISGNHTDTFYTSNSNDQNNKLLIKSNRRGRVEWSSMFKGDAVDIDFKNGFIYLLARLKYTNSTIEIKFGSSNFSVNTNSISDEYIIYKFDRTGLQLQATAYFSSRSRCTINEFKVVNEAQILFYLNINLFPGNKNQSDSISFKNRLIRFTNNDSDEFRCFLFSTDMNGNLNWHKKLGKNIFTTGDENKRSLMAVQNNKITVVTFDIVELGFGLGKKNELIYQFDLNGNLLNFATIIFGYYKSGYLESIIQDKAGNYYLTGIYTDSIFVSQKLIQYKNGRDRRGIVLKLSPDLKYIWHWTLTESSGNTNCGEFCVDSVGNLFVNFMYSDTIHLFNKEYYSKDNTLTILQLNSKGKLISKFDLPSSPISEYYQLWLDRKANLYLNGTWWRYYESPTIDVTIDSFSLISKRGLSFQAKYNFQKLNIQKRFLYCKGDSLHVEADEVYKWFKWVIDDSLIYFGKAIKPDEISPGKHKVLLYGYEMDSVPTIRKDSFIFYTAPQAGLKLEDKEICRYSPFNIFDTSAIEAIMGKNLTAKIIFGDGYDSTITFNILNSPRLNIAYTYKDTGYFNIEYQILHNTCRDTQILNKVIRVMEAPKPGFKVSVNSGCAPLAVNFMDSTTLNVKHKEYYFSDSNTWVNISLNELNFTHVFSKPGKYKVLQKLSGFTGCITQSDSVYITVSKGLGIFDSMHVENSTVQLGNALVYWKPIDGAFSYKIYKNGAFIKQTSDTFFMESMAYTEENYYTVQGIDSCGNSSSIGRFGKPILLKGNIVGNNSASILSFTNYGQWKGTEIIYQIQKRIGNNWVTINSNNNNFEFIDENLQLEGEINACYRIQAFEIDLPGLKTHSNELCIDFLPVIYIPTAFSPNNDNVNDIFKPYTEGIKNYQLLIVNRWGEIIFKGGNNEAWDGLSVPEGVYTVLINYTTVGGVNLNQRVNVTLIK